MADKYQTYPFSETVGPAVGAFAVTPSDSVQFAQTARGLYVGVSGDVAVVCPDGTSVVFVGLVAGIIHPIRATQVKSTGTTATSIVGVY